MTRRAPSFARAFTGRWRITELYEWDEIDLGGSAHITFSGKDHGKLAFLAVDGDVDVRYGSRDGAACAEFSWEGFDEGSAASGRGWAALEGAGRLVGHLFIQKVMTRLRRRTRVTSSTACSQVRLRQGQPVQLRSGRSAQRIGGGSFKRPLPEGFRMPAQREIDSGL